MSTRQSGTVRWFKDGSGYGFITPASGLEDLLVRSNPTHGNVFESLKEGQKVTFVAVQGEKQGMEAHEVQIEA